MSKSKVMSTEEGRLVAVHRAIRKIDHPQLISTIDASFIAAYISEIVDLDQLESLASETQLEYFLDGLILGIVVARLGEQGVPVEDLPKPQREQKKQFQTGVDPVSKEVRVNS